MTQYNLYRASKKTGKVDIALEGGSLAMLELWALQNTTKTKQTIIMDSEDNVVYCCIGDESGFPKVVDPNTMDIQIN